MSQTSKKPFVDFRAIRGRITMEQVLEHYGVLGTMKRSGTRLSGPCPIHNGSNPTQFRVETEKNIWNCFSECKHGGNVLDFITKKEDISLYDAALKACEWFNIPLDEVEDGESDHQATPPQQRAGLVGKAPAKTEPPDISPNVPLKFRLRKLQHEHPYIKDRGITLETAIDFGVGYFSGDKGLMRGRVVLPIHNAKGEVMAYVGRWPGEPPDKDTEKYKLPPGFKKTRELFNIDRAIKEPSDKPLVIVEGFFDAIRLHQHGYRKVVAIMGSTISDAQIELIHEHVGATGHVIVMFDEDNAGREGRDDAASRLAKFCFVKIHVFGTPNAQPEHLSADEIKQILGGAA